MLRTLTSTKENDKSTCSVIAVNGGVSQKVLTEEFCGVKLSDSLTPRKY
jgi:hypothetical protein